MGEPKTTNVRDFLRGGYRTAEEPTIVLSGSDIQGVWYPGRTGLTVSFTTNGSQQRVPGPVPGIPDRGDAQPVRPLSKADQAKGRSRR